MAYNPFAGFRKYQKFLMAMILLLCMITFVLCTGSQGDLSNLLLGIFSPRHGTVYAKLDGRSIYQQDLELVKRRRNMANDFMQRATKLVLTRVDQRIRDESDKASAGKEGMIRKDAVIRLNAIKQEMQLRLARTRYFEGGIKLKEVLDFMMWLDIAKRLDIDFARETLVKMLGVEMFAVVPLGGQNAIPLFDVQTDSFYLLREIRFNDNLASDANLLQALREEYRVRCANWRCSWLSPGPTRTALCAKTRVSLNSSRCSSSRRGRWASRTTWRATCPHANLGNL